MDIKKEFEEVIRLVEKSGGIARKYFNSDDTSNEQKADKSVVTRIDREIEEVLLNHIKERFPNDTIVGEEHGRHEGKSNFEWHIDPIDGTDNFVRKVPFCAISVARLGDVENSFAIVHNPITKHTFSSLRDSVGDVYENERVCHMTAESLGGRYVIAIGRGRDEEWMKPAGYALQSVLGLKFGKSSSYGSAALELAYVSANRFDAFLTFGLKSYDYAAGLFLIKAAGGAISIFEDGQWKLWTESIKKLCSQHNRTILASHPEIHEDLISYIEDPSHWADKTARKV